MNTVKFCNELLAFHQNMLPRCEYWHTAADEFVKMNEGHLFHYSGQQIPKHFTLVQHPQIAQAFSNLFPKLSQCIYIFSNRHTRWFWFSNSILIHSECPQTGYPDIRGVVHVQNGCCLRPRNAEEAVSVAGIEAPLSRSAPQSVGTPRSVPRRPLNEPVSVEERDKGVGPVGYQNTLKCVSLWGENTN